MFNHFDAKALPMLHQPPNALIFQQTLQQQFVVIHFIMSAFIAIYMEATNNNAWVLIKQLLKKTY